MNSRVANFGEVEEEDSHFFDFLLFGIRVDKKEIKNTKT
jgi:hypothetical protein